MPGDYARVAVGTDTPAGWNDHGAAYAIDDAGIEHPGNASTDRVLLYFTSGTTSRPKLVEHTHLTYPVGHLSTLYWLGVRPGDVHLNISSPGWAKHAWSNFFAPWLAEATVFVVNYTRFDPATLLGRLREEQVNTFCAPPTVWRMLINADLSGGPGHLREAIGAGEPLNPEVIAQVQKQWGLTIRDGFGQTETTASVGNTPGQPVKPGSMGRPLPGVPVVLVDPASGHLVDGPGRGRDLPRPGPAAVHADDRLPGRRRPQRRGDGRRVLPHRRRREPGRGRVHHLRRAHRRRLQGLGLQDQPVRAGVGADRAPGRGRGRHRAAPDPVRLAVPKAYVVLAPGTSRTADTARSILAYAREHLPPYLRVRRLEFAELPKTISGKIRRVELRAREEQIAGTRVDGEYRDDDFPELKNAR